jgi:histidine triad (HIT) family protein
LFCGIASGEISTELVYSDAEIIAFGDINPQAPVHILVVPRKHIENYATASEDDEVLLGRMCLVAAGIARDEGVGESGFRTVVNNGPDANQAVQHLHMHVLGGRHMGWPPG